METPIQPENPYLARPSEEWMVSRNVATSSQPRWLKPIAIIAMIVGVLGFGNGLLSLLGVLFQKLVQNMVQFRFNAAPGAAGPNAEMEALTRRMQQDILTIQQENWISLLLFSILSVVVGGLLFWGALCVLRNRPNSLDLLRKAFILATVYLLGQGILTTYVWFETKPVTERFFNDLVRTMPQPQRNAGGAEIMKASMRIALTVTLILQWMFTLTKILLYVLGAIYLTKLIKKLQTADITAEVVTT